MLQKTRTADALGDPEKKGVHAELSRSVLQDRVSTEQGRPKPVEIIENIHLKNYKCMQPRVKHLLTLL